MDDIEHLQRLRVERDELLDRAMDVERGDRELSKAGLVAGCPPGGQIHRLLGREGLARVE
jgi:hypothetical protein